MSDVETAALVFFVFFGLVALFYGISKFMEKRQ
jgi:hypothetical protein